MDFTQQLTNPTVQYDTFANARYAFNNGGNAPRGRGWWVFEVKYNGNRTATYRDGQFDTFTAAKRRALKWARKNAPVDATFATVSVCS